MDAPEIFVKNNKIGKDNPCFIIAEVAQAHDGSLGMAHSYIDAVANAGADAIKFQTHIASEESTPDEPWRIKFSLQDSSRYAYWKRMEFSESQWKGLIDHANERELCFLSSPFSGKAIELLLRIGIPAWKIASGEINNLQLLDYLLQTKLPILLSTGMSNFSEIDRAVDKIKNLSVPFVVMQCTSVYPCPPEKVGLNCLSFFRERFDCPVGLSDHSGTIYPGLAAATIGVDVLEVHVTMSREMFGPDVSASVTTDELKQLVEGVRFIEKMRINLINKNDLAHEMQPLRQAFMKSIVARRDLKAGTILSEKDLAFKKPGTGISAERFGDILRKKLKRDIVKDEQFRESDIEKGA